MEKQQVNPWRWQERFGFSHAWRVEGASALLFVSGQGPLSADGELVGAGDFEAQVRQTFENLRVVLEQAGASQRDVVKMTVYLTDMARLRDFARIRAEVFGTESPASTAVGVTGLAFGMELEVDVFAVL